MGLRDLSRSGCLILLWALGAGAEPPVEPAREGPRGIRPAQIKALARGALRIDSFSTTQDGELLAELAPAAGKGERSLVAVPDCSALYRQVRSQRRARRVGGAAFPLEISFGLISHAGQPVVDLAADYCEHAHMESSSVLTRNYTLLSLVGPVLSVQLSVDESLAGGNPHHYQRWEARDVLTGELINVTRLVDRDSLAEALRQDPFIKERFGGVAAHEKLETMLETLYPPYIHGKESAFAFHAYDRAKDLVALRLGFLRDSCIACRITQLGLWVKPTPEMRQHFVQAAAGNGFYMSSAFQPRRLE